MLLTCIRVLEMRRAARRSHERESQRLDAHARMARSRWNGGRLEPIRRPAPAWRVRHSHRQPSGIAHGALLRRHPQSAAKPAIRPASLFSASPILRGARFSRMNALQNHAMSMRVHIRCERSPLDMAYLSAAHPHGSLLPTRGQTSHSSFSRNLFQLIDARLETIRHSVDRRLGYAIRPCGPTPPAQHASHLRGHAACLFGAHPKEVADRICGFRLGVAVVKIEPRCQILPLGSRCRIDVECRGKPPSYTSMQEAVVSQVIIRITHRTRKNKYCFYRL